MCVHPTNICDGSIECSRYSDDEIFCDFQYCSENCRCTGLMIVCNQTRNLDISLSNLHTVRIIQLHNIKISSNSRWMGKRNSLIMLNLTNIVFQDDISKTFRYLNNLLYLSMAHIHFPHTSRIFIGLASMLEMQFTDCNLNHIYPYTFAGVSLLDRLNLNNSHISIIEGNSFCDLYHLVYLNLDNNYITKINKDTFQCLFNLTILSLRGNHICTVSIYFHNMKLYVNNKAMCCYLAVGQGTCYVNDTINNYAEIEKTCDRMWINCFICKTTLWVCGIAIVLLNAYVIVYRSICNRHLLKTNVHMILVASGDICFGLYWFILLFKDWYYRKYFMNLQELLQTDYFCKYFGILPELGIYLPQTYLVILSAMQLLTVKYPLRSEKVITYRRWFHGCALGYVVAVICVVICFHQSPEKYSLCFRIIDFNTMTRHRSQIYMAIYPVIGVGLRTITYVGILYFVDESGKVKTTQQRSRTNKKFVVKTCHSMLGNVVTCASLLTLIFYLQAIAEASNKEQWFVITIVCLSISPIVNPVLYSLALLFRKSN